MAHESTRHAFQSRHIGPDATERDAMLKAIGAASLDALIDEAIPAGIRLRDAARRCRRAESEAAVPARPPTASPRGISVFRSYIGLATTTASRPSVILRNVLENPGWYTPYTPYQAEIAQGRLEALLNFQTMVRDLTGMEVANASLLDEATAAAEAMTMLHRVQGQEGAIGGQPAQFFVVGSLSSRRRSTSCSSARRAARHRAA